MRTADIDFETYSEAGYYWDGEREKWRPINSSPPYGLPAVGAAAYAEHPSTEVLSLAYDLHDGMAPRLWVPGCPPPRDLFDHIAAGGTLTCAWNALFEFFVWHYVCHQRMGWPALPLSALFDDMAKAKAWGLPGKLAEAAKAAGIEQQKDKAGDRLIKKFSIPRNPTKHDARTRIRPEEDPQDAGRFQAYNLQDIVVERAVADCCPPLTDQEMRIWRMDQSINVRGVQIDRDALEACKRIIAQATDRYHAELRELTNGAASAASELERIKAWMAGRGVAVDSMDAEAVETLLARDDIPADVRRVVEIRASLGSASVKKLYAIDRRLSGDGRLRELFAYYGAERTGRWAGRGPQPQNLPGSGPDAAKCVTCGWHHAAALAACPRCGWGGSEPVEWSIACAEDALADIRTGSLDAVEGVWRDAVAAVAGCLRALFCAGRSQELISSDYTAIEAVVLAAIAGEEWRLEVFRTHGKIYEASAAAAFRTPLQDILDHKEQTGRHHPLRKKGKVSELASGYQGSVGAYRAFGAEGTDDEILGMVRAWRQASPTIPRLWYGLEDAARAAIHAPGHWYTYTGATGVAVSYIVWHNVLYCQLPSGRMLAYQRPRLVPWYTPWGKPVEKIIFEGWNSDYKRGSIGWQRMDTYGGKLTENVVQATSRDILAHGMLGLEGAGYPIVMHVHDEPVSEVSLGYGSIEQYEAIMTCAPAWCADWPIRAAGGWRGQRYRKD